MRKKNLISAIERFYFFLNRCNQIKRARKIKGKKSLKFITLTLASEQQHEDRVIKFELLNQFLTELRTKFSMHHYIWKAEKQKNGNIHFHIIVDVYIKYSQIREIWNRIQNKLGYVDRFKNNIVALGFDHYVARAMENNSSLTLSQCRARWRKGQETNWENPPSTEIRQVEKVRKIGAYFAKYFSKPTSLDPGFGRIWFASRELTQDIQIRKLMCSEDQELFSNLVKYFPDRFKQYDYCSAVYINFTLIEKRLNSELIRFAASEFDKFALEFW